LRKRSMRETMIDCATATTALPVCLASPGTSSAWAAAIAAWYQPTNREAK
jgi:hypothetical protein